MPRELVLNFDKNGMKIDDDSLRNLTSAQTKNMYTGVMDMRTKTIYLAALRTPEKKEDDHYGTVTPAHLDAFPCMVLGTVVQPILHKVNDPADKDKQITSHDQLAQKVISILGNGSCDDFCGFALRFEAGQKVMLAPTSRTLNPGGNGQLETSILEALLVYLKPKLALLTWNLEIASARVTPDMAQAQRGGPLIPKGLLAGIKAAKAK